MRAVYHNTGTLGLTYECCDHTVYKKMKVQQPLHNELHKITILALF